MQNDIMGERLKGLYFACISLSSENLFNIFESYFLQIFNFSADICSQDEENLKLLQKCVRKFITKIKKGLGIINLRKEIDNDIKKLKFSYKDIVEKLSTDIDQLFKEKQIFQKNFEEITKKISDFEEEYEKIRKRVKEIRTKNNHYVLNE